MKNETPKKKIEIFQNFQNFRKFQDFQKFRKFSDFSKKKYELLILDWFLDDLDEDAGIEDPENDEPGDE